MVQQEFLDKVIATVSNDDSAIGLAVAGSWITGEIDAYSDLDLVLVTRHAIAPDGEAMSAYAARFGNLLNAFTGEHVGEKRLLICLYNEPLLHVDIKFLVLSEYEYRVENPVIVWERGLALSAIQEATGYQFPYPDYQWIEDRFWTWIHYAATKIGRGELFEAYEFISFLRQQAIAPLLQIRNGNLPKGLRKVEWRLSATDLSRLRSTVALYDRASIIAAITQCISIYRELRGELFASGTIRRTQTELVVMDYFTSLTT